MEKGMGEGEWKGIWGETANVREYLRVVRRHNRVETS